ncbi:hypothetical protein L7F22_010375 [Adiantum nelumboides]|nr:hypothetical protein [Adiantum nelumboides]
MKHRYQMERVTEFESDTGNGTEESDHSRWKMRTGRANRRKERSEGHTRRTPESRYRKDKGLDLKIAYPSFKGKRHDDLNVHIQAFEQYAELKHILEEEWGEYFPHTLKEAARKWYYHYPASKLQPYRKLEKAFILEYTNDRGDEDILCELDKIKQSKLSVKKYVQKIKGLTRRLNEPPSEKRMRAWFLNGFNSKKLREQEVPAPSKKFTKLVHKALKLKQSAKEEKSTHMSKSESNTSESTEIEKSSSSSSKSSKDDRKKKRKKAQCPDSEKPAAPEIKQPEPVPVRAITRSSGVVIDELPIEEPAPSKLNPKAKEWEQSSTWKEKGKAKKFDEWEDQRELAAKNTENLEKKKPEVPECSEARSIQRIPVAVTEALLLETQNVATDHRTGGHQAKSTAMAKLIKEKKKQAEAMTVEVPQIKDDEVPVIELDYKNTKQWEPLSEVILDGGARVNIIGEHMKEKMGITKFKPAVAKHIKDKKKQAEAMTVEVPQIKDEVPINEGIVRQVATSFNKNTNTAIVNNRKLQLTPAILEHIFKIPNASEPKPYTAEEISQYFNENPEQKQKTKAAGQGVTVSDLPKQKAYKFTVKAVGLKNCNSYISEKMLGMLLARELKPDAPINRRPQPPLTITAAREPDEPAGSRDWKEATGRTNKCSWTKKAQTSNQRTSRASSRSDASIQTMEIQDSPAKSPSSDYSASHHD